MDSSSIRPAAETNSIGAYRRLLHAITASTAAPTSSPAKTMMSAIRMMRSRVPAARCLRSQSSGTKTYGRAETTSSPAIPTSMRGSPCGSARNGRVGEGERPVGARLQLRGTRRHFPDLSACRVEAEPFGDGLARRAPARRARSSDAPARSSGTMWRTRSTRPSAATSTPHSSARSATSPWNVATRTDQPGAGQVRADQLTPPRFAGGLGDELVRPVAAVERQRHHAPFAIERDAALGHGPPRRRLGVLTRGRQSRRARISGLLRRWPPARPPRSPAMPSGRVVRWPPAALRRRRSSRSMVAGGVQAALRSAGESSVQRPAWARRTRTIHSGTSTNSAIMAFCTQMPGASASRMGMANSTTSNA